MKLRKESIEIIKKMDIELIYIFGSVITKTQNENSDIDIAILFKDGLSLDTSKSYFELYKAFSKEFIDKEIDIVYLNNAPLTLKFDVITHGKIIYKDSEIYGYNYRENVIKEYIDFKPLLDYNEKQLLERI